jgi:hypothetical protein
LADQKSRIFHGKWTRSLPVDGEKLIGFIMGYERASENNLSILKPIYLSELAIQPENRGQFGSKLLTAFSPQSKNWHEDFPINR